MTSAHERERLTVLFAVGALGVSCVMTQLALLRELLAAFSGNEMVLGIVLGLWLLLTGIGTWLGRTAGKLRNPIALLVAIQILLAILPLLQVFLLRTLRNALFVRGATVGVAETSVSAFILLLPYCLAAGYTLTLACAILSRCARVGTPNQDPGRVYVADGFGSIAGGVLFSFVLARFLDHIAILVFPAMLNLLAAWAMAFCTGRRRLSTAPVVAAAGVLATTVLIDLDGISTGLEYSRQHIVARPNSPYGKLLVTESDGQFDFMENGLPLASTRDDQHVEEAVHYAMAQRPDARNVLLVGGGISGTAKEILKYGVRRVDYVELDPLILELGRKYMPENLAGPAIHIINADGRLFVRQSLEKYDVVIIDLPAPSTAQLNRFYTVEWLGEVKRTLAPDGVVSFPLGHYENYVGPELARVLASAHHSLKRLFRNVLIIPGGQVFFLGSDGPLFEDIAARIEGRGIKVKLVNRHYLEAMLAADRMEDIERAVAQPAAVNRDFSPVLYYYHLRHWMSQFNVRFAALLVLPLLLLCVCLVRLRGAALVLFASGFAGTALEIVLLLAFQVLCGSVYHQVGIIVTVFMAGLAVGALMTNRLTKPGRGALPRALADAQVGLTLSTRGCAKNLALLALSIAGYAAVLPFLLPLLYRLGGPAAGLLMLKTAVALLTLIPAVLVGMQFPLANHLEFGGTTAAASRLYTADFVGAFLGALLAGALLIPLIGVAGVCALIAGLNLFAAAMMQLRKAVT